MSRHVPVRLPQFRRSNLLAAMHKPPETTHISRMRDLLEHDIYIKHNLKIREADFGVGVHHE